METATETKQATRRAIDLTTCEVWCPLHKSDVCVYDHCLAGTAVIDGKVNFRDRCSHYVNLHFMGRVLCAWPEDAPPRDPFDLPASSLL